MDTKTKIMELIRELAEATTLAAQLGKNVDYPASLGNNIEARPQVDSLYRDAENLRNMIDMLNMDVMANAQEC